MKKINFKRWIFIVGFTLFLFFILQYEKHSLRYDYLIHEHGFTAKKNVKVSLVNQALAGEPGSASDPIVTKSFLEESYGWKLITVTVGDKLSFDMGSESILRSGKAVVMGSESGGLVDLTLGEDLPDGVSVPANHYLISSAGDGRGIRALTTSVFLTRGLVR